MLTKEAVLKALEQVIDPELDVDIVNLGLIYDVQLDGGQVTVDMTLTTPGCPLSGSLPAAAEHVVQRLEGVEQAKVNLVWNPPWNPQKMTPAGRAKLGRR